MKKQLFDTGWECSEAQGMMKRMMPQWKPVVIPHDASIEKPRSAQNPSAAGGGYAWGGVITYRKKFNVPLDWKDRSIILEFEGVYMYAQVAVNGNVTGVHPYGYTSFQVDLKPYLKFGAENEVTVEANNGAQPNSRWYSGTGLYRHAWLRIGDSVHIKPWGVFVTTPLAAPASSQVAVNTDIANTSGVSRPVILRSKVMDASGSAVAQVESPLTVEAYGSLNVSQNLNITNARLWSVDTPSLYTLSSEILMDGQVIDTESTMFGIRTIAVDAQSGFRLNGVPMKLKGGCVHHDNGLLGAASYDRAEERKIELMKSAGYNAIRCAHNPPAPAMLDACDRLGMLVIDETFDCWRMGKNPNDYHLVFEDWWQRDTESMVNRDRNHP
jgi:beta-galactosidase